jgi:hypothetical protein
MIECMKSQKEKNIYKKLHYLMKIKFVMKSFNKTLIAILLFSSNVIKSSDCLYKHIMAQQAIHNQKRMRAMISQRDHGIIASSCFTINTSLQAPKTSNTLSVYPPHLCPGYKEDLPNYDLRSKGPYANIIQKKETKNIAQNNFAEKRG